MKQNYFILVLAHSIHGRLRRVHVPYRVLYAVLGLALLGSVSLLGVVSSYARMAWKVANYNALRQETETLRKRYDNLQRVVNQTDEQLASLKVFANEVSVAYGIKQRLEGPADIATEGRLVPTFHESLSDYNGLRSIRSAKLERSYVSRFFTDVQPTLWPVEGRLVGHFGSRNDPFSGQGAIHTGVDISAPTGTPVRTTADGVVNFAGRFSGYGQIVIISHGNGMETYYAHLSKFDVIDGQTVRKGDIVGRVGATGRVTAPHLHYEVRIGKAPMNPYRFLVKSTIAQTPRKDFPF